jgi:hypothetical protein
MMTVMRMWMVDTTTMCRKHLLGEHVETHMILGTLKSGIRLDGYARNNLLELKSFKKRHDKIAVEIVRRGLTTAARIWDKVGHLLDDPVN